MMNPPPGIAVTSTADLELLSDIRRALPRCWAADTAAKRSDYSADNPARGQCVPTALVIHELVGLGVWQTTMQGESHYVNALPDGRIVDLTRSQYPKDATYGRMRRARPDYSKHTKRTRPRYELLLARVLEQLEQEPPF